MYFRGLEMMGEGTSFRRLDSKDYPTWRLLAEASQREQSVPRLQYWEKWSDTNLLWGAEVERNLVGYVFLVDAPPYMQRGVAADHKLRVLARLPRFGVADLYVSPDYRGKNIAAEVLRAALHDLGVGDDEPIALSMPVRPVARSALRSGLGEDRLVVGYMDNGYLTHPTTIDEITERSKQFVRRRQNEKSTPPNA